MQVKQILETCLCVDNLAQAEAFYSRVLGLVAFSRVEGRHVFFRCGNGVFLLFNPAKTRQPAGDVPTHGTGGPGHVAFAMQESDVPAWREHLRQNGVEIETEITWPNGGYSIYFRDPAGNSVELTTPETWRL
ncbi:VOC family protein [Candidatus Poribacteria bacterium]|nr:VOC family protein [Candidatus Poribacteria bacterium]